MLPSLFMPQPIRRDQSPQDDGEDFDFNNVASSDDEGPPTPASRAANPVINPVAQVINDPEPSKKNANIAYDVWHYFVREDNSIVCQVCKYVAHS